MTLSMGLGIYSLPLRIHIPAPPGTSRNLTLALKRLTLSGNYLVLNA